MAYILNRMPHYFEDAYYAVNHQCTNMSRSALRFIHLTAVWACNYAHTDLHSHHTVVQNQPNQSQLHCQHNISLFTSCRFLENRSLLLVLWSTVLVNKKKRAAMFLRRPRSMDVFLQLFVHCRLPGVIHPGCLLR